MGRDEVSCQQRDVLRAQVEGEIVIIRVLVGTPERNVQKLNRLRNRRVLDDCVNVLFVVGDSTHWIGSGTVVHDVDRDL
jgi:hypothetical protein